MAGISGLDSRLGDNADTVDHRTHMSSQKKARALL